MVYNSYQLRLLSSIVIAFAFFQKRFVPPKAEEYENDAEWRDSFDYIIVGGGSAGSSLARLLAEDNRNFSILIIESGGAEDGSSALPLPIGLQKDTIVDWGYKTVSQLNASLNTKDQKIRISAGRGLGGTSIMAYKMFIRGNKRDLDSWGKEYGCPEWTWDALEKYRLLMENAIDKELQTGHGKDGPVPISRPEFTTPLFDRWIKTGAELNYPQIPSQDYNLGDNWGFHRCQFMYNQSVLRSAASLFLQPFLKTKRNIKILLNHHVKRIRFDKSKRAVGVEYISVQEPNNVKFIEAAREVILSAGVFRTPQILHLSGIGPKDIINKLKNEPKSKLQTILANENVGKNLHDHAHVHGITAVLRENVSDSIINANNDWMQYFINRTGDFVVPFAIEGLATISSNVNPNKDHPDFELYMQPISITNNFPSFGRMILGILGFREEVLNKYYKEYENRTCIPIQLSLLHSKSRGEVITESLDPLKAPKLDFQFLSDPEDYDLKVLMDGIRHARRIIRSKSLFDYIEGTMETPVPGCEHLFDKPDSEEYVECWVRHMTGSALHPVGTCAMGSKAARSVVDCKLRVHGLKNLRIVDASVFPRNVRGHPLAMIFILAYKAAEMILKNA